MLLTILAVWFGYKKAKATRRNPFLWALVCGAAFIGTQFLVAVLIGFAIGIGIELLGWPETTYENYQLAITLIAIVASIISLLLIFRHLDRIPAEVPLVQPPPPPTFNDNQ